jgi:hypothetical protein
VAGQAGGARELSAGAGGYATVAVLLLAGWAALDPWPMSWLYLAVVFAFELWLARGIARAGHQPPAAGEAPYHFSDEEARLIGRYRFYFAMPAAARQCSSVLAAAGLTALVLAPWLLYKQQLLAAALIGLNLLAVARLTKRVAPLMALTVAARRGEREALRALELHDPLWTKIRAANEAERKMAR